MEKVTFTPNVPVQVALRYPEGKQVEGRFGDQMLYSLVNGQVMYLDLDVAAKINALAVRKGEPFSICKRWTGKKGDPMQWDIWRPGAGETAPAAPAMADLENSPLEADVLRRRESAERSQPGAGAATPAPAAAAAKAQPPAVSNGNGNTPAGVNGKGAPGPGGTPPPSGPGNGHGTGAHVYTPGQFVPPTKIPMNQAVIDAVRMVQTAMKATGEQWSDDSRQGLVSTILIAAERQGWLAVWKREATQ